MADPAHTSPPLAPADVDELDRRARVRAFLAWFDAWEREAASDPTEPDWSVEDLPPLRLRPAAIEP